MNKNIVIPIIIAVIILGLVFVLAQQYIAQEQRRAAETIIPTTSVKPAVSAQQEIQNIDVGNVEGDFKAVDADINSL